MQKYISLLILMVILGCQESPNLNELSPFADPSKSVVQVVIEISSGDHRKFEYNKEQKQFEAEIIDGKPRDVQYLAYPTNYGFIPSTLSDESEGGDGDPIDILLLSKRLETGRVVQAIPLATMRLVDRGEIDDKVILVPVDESLRMIPCTTWQCIQDEYPSIITILETWFTSYKGANLTVSAGWVGTDSTMAIIREATYR
jgi:inorganic pyrophosphatase